MGFSKTMISNQLKVYRRTICKEIQRSMALEVLKISGSKRRAQSQASF